MVPNFIGIIILTVYFWLIAAISTLITTIICVPFYPFVKTKQFNKMYERTISFLIMNAMIIPRFWTFKIKDLRNLKDKNKPSIYVPNHSSFIDTLLTAHIPAPKKFIMKSVYTHIPFFGWLCVMAGHIPVNQSNKSTIIERCIRSMKDGSSFLIYAEGTRSTDSKLLPFKTGAFRLSQQSGIPIVPVAIKGSGQAMPIGGYCQMQQLEMIIGDPIVVDDIEIGINKTRKFIQNHIS